MDPSPEMIVACDSALESFSGVVHDEMLVAEVYKAMVAAIADRHHGIAEFLPGPSLLRNGAQDAL